jgi:5-oxoprolinase (ATP-hydrolysing) subunit A
MVQIAINSDVAEGFGAWSFGDDAGILKHVTAANVACGFHAGDPSIIREVCTTAAATGVSIGAQVSYRDLAGFGRRFMDIKRADLVNDLLYQIGALRIFAETAGSRVNYVKAHGALYNAAARNKEHARAIAEAVATAGRALPLLCQPATETWTAALSAGVVPLAEVFADRAYTTEGLLVDRAQPGALITDPEEVADRCLQMATENTVKAITGETVHFTQTPATICLHSDTPGAANIAARLAATLRQGGVQLVGIGAGT